MASAGGVNPHEALYRDAQAVLPGGVSSSIRSSKALGRPFYVSRGEGAYLYDLEGREYVDLLTSHGATLLGHNHPGIRAAIEEALRCGIICSSETPAQTRVAAALAEIIPCIDMVRFTCSGTEATMHAIRLAREYTGRDKILKFEGHFHGLHDYVMWNYGGWTAGTGPETDGPPGAPRHVPRSGGIPAGIADYVVVLPCNDLEAVRRTLWLHGHEIAAVILEPIHYNAGCIVPPKEYLHGLRELTKEYGVVLIFDEILSGFRTGPGCAQAYFNVVPDLCTIGKCVAGGTPLSVFGGRREIMEHVRPLGNAEHSGTYNGHLISILAAEVCLREIRRPGFYDRLYTLADRLYPGMNAIFERRRFPARLQGLGARFGLYFGFTEEVRTYRDTARQDAELGLKFFEAMMARGVYFCDAGGKPMHHGFTAAHTLADMDRVLQAAEDSVCSLGVTR
ncbi:MAG TPA: aspartate aminotransferase family protein [Candidatus Methylomirabilis sp.]|nr:aspartate aminotransferase family protein [Candidatus Methylomirabilis sp.]